MHREDKSNYILFIEPDPKRKSDTPVEDDIVLYMEYLLELESTEKGTSGYSDMTDTGSFRTGHRWKGTHRTDCGEKSENFEYRFMNGMITNSLAPYYLRWYRKQIPLIHLIQLVRLYTFYQQELAQVRTN